MRRGAHNLSEAGGGGAAMCRPRATLGGSLERRKRMPATTVARMPIAARLERDSMPCPATGCTLWLAELNSGGYGRLKVRQRYKAAHRLAWELAKGPIPPGMMVCHRCDVPACINAVHLFLGTHADNAADRERKGRTKSPTGHAIGEACGNSRLTPQLVRDIRASRLSNAAVARNLGVAKSTVSRVRSGGLWAHVQ